jgi:hypothetical protein
MPDRFKAQNRAIGLGWLLMLSLVTMAFIPTVAKAVLSPVFAVYDRYFPVVTMRGEITGSSESAIVVHMAGTKNRNCKYVRLQAFAGKGDILRDVNLMRIDVPESGATKPQGTFDIGYWRIWPVDKSETVLVFAQHDCDGRTVITKIAEVTL